MPAVSKKQQRFMGMVRAAQKGKLDNPSKEISDAAESMSEKDVKKFAKTKHDKLPERVEQKEAFQAGFMIGYEQKFASKGLLKTIGQGIKTWGRHGASGFDKAHMASRPGANLAEISQMGTQVRPGLSKSLATLADYAPAVPAGYMSYKATEEAGRPWEQAGINALIAGVFASPKFHRRLISKGQGDALKSLEAYGPALAAKIGLGGGAELFHRGMSMAESGDRAAQAGAKASEAFAKEAPKQAEKITRLLDDASTAAQAIPDLEDTMRMGFVGLPATEDRKAIPGVIPLMVAKADKTMRDSTKQLNESLNKLIDPASQAAKSVQTALGTEDKPGTLTESIGSVGGGLDTIGKSINEAVSTSTRGINNLSDNLNDALEQVKVHASNPRNQRIALIGLAGLLGTYGLAKLIPIMAERPRSVRYYYT